MKMYLSVTGWIWFVLAMIMFVIDVNPVYGCTSIVISNVFFAAHMIVSTIKSKK